MAGIKHATRAAGTNIKNSAVWGEDHEIEGGAIGSTEIADGSVTTGKIADNAVTNAKMADDSVDTAEIVDDAVTLAKLGELYFFVKSGRSPITFAHGIGETPTGIVVTPNAVQPYAWSYDADGTNIKIYHNAVGSLTFSIIAWV